jgi:hypothetical protein
MKKHPSQVQAIASAGGFFAPQNPERPTKLLAIGWICEIQSQSWIMDTGR